MKLARSIEDLVHPSCVIQSSPSQIKETFISSWQTAESKARAGAPCRWPSPWLSLTVGSKNIVKMSILTIKKKACLLLLAAAARSCSSFFAPPDNCGASYRSRCDRAVKAAYSGGRCIDSSRHSPSALGKCHSPLRITPVEQLDFETGEVINSFPSIKEAARALGIPREGVSDVLNGRRKSSGGFFWCRSGDDVMPTARGSYGRVPIEQLDFETGEVINSFPSIKEAARALGIPPNCVSDVLNGRSKSSGGFFWRRSGDDVMPTARTYG